VCSDRNIEDNPRETISTGATRATPSNQHQNPYFSINPKIVSSFNPYKLKK